MDKLAVISDIHSNLEALTSVLNDISKQSIQKIVSLGDNIGYGPDPEDVLLKLKSYSVTSICGNHEFTQRISLLDDKQYIINAGSVGQPRHGVHEATYVIWDIQKSTVEPRFVTYNYHHTAMKIKQAGLPWIYADIL